MHKEAEKILQEIKKYLLQILIDEAGENNYGSYRNFLFFIEEDYKYSIKKLNLKKEEEIYYINKIVDIFGPLSEDIPTDNKKGLYYDDFYYK